MKTVEELKDLKNYGYSFFQQFTTSEQIAIIINKLNEVIEGYANFVKVPYIKGNWSQNENYIKFDLVNYNGETYICKRNCYAPTDIKDTYYFEKLSYDIELLKEALDHYKNVEEWDKIFTETSGKIEEKYTIRLNQIETNNKKITEHEIFNENDLDLILSKKYESAILKNNIEISNMKILDKINFKLNLNGFTLKASDNFNGIALFEIGKNEYEDFYNKYSKWLYNGRIDLNNKLISVLKHTFSWDLKCYDLRIINAMKGFIQYDVGETQSTRGAEGYFSNISIIGSENIPRNTIAFDIWIGDSIINNLYSQYFTIGLKTRVGGIQVSNCHFWGLPFSSNKINQIMKIGIINEEYYNYFQNIICDSMDRYDQNQPASLENGGIAIYDKVSANNRYVGIDILPHATTGDKTLIGIYLNKPSTVDEKYFGQSIIINKCYCRNNPKILKGVSYDGNIRNISISESDLNINGGGNVRNYNRLTSNTCVFKYDSKMSETDGISDYSLCSGSNEFQMINDDFGMNILIRDKDKNAIFARINEKRNNPYSSQQLQTLADKLKAQSLISGQLVNMKEIYCVLYDGTVQEGNVGRYDLCWFEPSSKRFLKFRTGQFVTT